ncbi:hypothetical protein VPH35_043829 [Triticum aestivum]
MMAALRCAARRLGGSLLQRTQAGERRQLMPSRLMRCREQRQTTEKIKIQQKKEALYDAVGNAKQKHWELYDALSKAVETTNQHLFVQGTPQQNSYRCILVLDTSIFATSNLERREYGRRAQGVIELAAKTTCFVEFSVSMVGLSGMKDRMSKLRESSEDNVEI